MKLSPRLKTIADLVNKDSIVADIGTDHGYIPVYLIENNVAKKVIAADINEGPLKSAISYINKKKLANKIDTRLGDGLGVIEPNEVDTVIIAGMGGILISDILDASKSVTDTINSFILQPMIAAEDLRRYLYMNNYKITNERLSREDNRIYEVIYVEHGKDLIEDDIYFEIGKRLLEKKDPLLPFFIEKKISKYDNILNSIQSNNSIQGKVKYDELKIKHRKLLEVKMRL